MIESGQTQRTQYTPMTKIDYELLYGTLHRMKPKLMAGQSICRRSGIIKELIEQIGGAERILDYGSGKGHQYLINRIHEDWGVRLPYCYDIGISGLRRKPEGLFDAVLCSDVLEHIHEDDLDEVLEDIFGYVYPDKRCFIYLGIDTVEARKVFVGVDDVWSGKSVHLTVQPSAWWDEKLAKYRKRPNLILKVVYYQEKDRPPAGEKKRKNPEEN